MKLLDTLSGNYVITLFLFAIVMKLVLLPMGIKQQKNQIKQASLRPKEMAIRKKYAGRNDKATQQKMQQDIMDLYQRENYNPMGGCLPMLLQMVIVIILYQIIQNPLTYICELSKEAINVIEVVFKDAVADTSRGQLGYISAIIANKPDFSTMDFSAFPEIAQPVSDSVRAELANLVLPNFNFFTINLSATPSFTSFNWLLTVPVLVFISQYGTMKLSRKFTYQPEQQGDAAKSMALMDITMPLMSVWFSFMLPAILGVYWVMQSILSLVQTIILSKCMPLPRFTEEDYKKAERELKGKATKASHSGEGSGKKVRSLHHIDDDDDVPAVPPAKEELKKDSVIEPAPLKEDDREEK